MYKLVLVGFEPARSVFGAYVLTTTRFLRITVKILPSSNNDLLSFARPGRLLETFKGLIFGSIQILTPE